MSKKEAKCDSLPKLQRKIVMCLAKEGPMIIRETNKKIRGEYSSTNRAFHDLETKDMITRVDIREYRKREFPKYWLTVRGSAFALLNHANPETVKRNALASSKSEEDKKAIEVYFMLRSLGQKIANILDNFMLSLGRIEPEELIKQLLPLMVSMKLDEIEKVFDTAKKTEYWPHTKKTMTEFKDELDKVLDHD